MYYYCAFSPKGVQRERGFAPFAGLLAIRSRKSCVNSSASYEVDLPCLLVRSVCLSFCARSEADAWNSVTSHDGYAVCGECPFVSKWTGFSHLFCLSVSKTGFTVQVLVSIFKSFCYFVIFRDSPCREVAFDFVFASCVRWTVLVVNGNDFVFSVFF